MIEGKCNICKENFKNCEECSRPPTADATQCNLCEEGYSLKEGTCLGCSTFIDSCFSCKFDGLDPICEKCSQSKYLDVTENKCFPCETALKGCKSCSSNTKCDVCDDPTAVIEDGQCVQGTGGSGSNSRGSETDGGNGAKVLLIIVFAGVLVLAGIASYVVKRRRELKELEGDEKPSIIWSEKDYARFDGD